MTLLEKAKSFKTKQLRYEYGKEEIELGIAWLKGEITPAQASKALGHKASHSSIYLRLLMSIREAYSKGILTESKK